MQQNGVETQKAAEKKAETSAPLPPLAKLRLVYESRDKRMCLFEDAEGHLTAAPAHILA